MNEEIYKNVLNGETIELGKESYVSPSVIVDFLAKKGYDYEIESNGWQHDFWINFTHNDENIKDIMLSGCWYYGGQTLEIV